jgi:hypothetical protein
VSERRECGVWSVEYVNDCVLVVWLMTAWLLRGCLRNVGKNELVSRV